MYQILTWFTRILKWRLEILRGGGEGMANITAIRQELLFNTRTLLAPKGYLYAGYPNYPFLFGRDSCISAWQLLPIDPNIARCTIIELSELQAKEEDPAKDAEFGKILHEYRENPEDQKKIPKWSWPYYGSVDSTAWFLILLKKYVDQTKDLNILQEIWPSPVLAVEWHLNNSNRHPAKFITYQRKNPHGLYHQCWKDSPEDHLKIEPPVAIVEVQGYAYLALKNYLQLQEISGLTFPYTQEAARLMETLRANFVKYFWMKEEQYFALGLDRNNTQRKAITSNPGHLLMCEDFLEQKYAKAVVTRLFKKDMWTIGGIRTHSEKEPDFDPLSYHLGSIWPHDNWIIYIGLLNFGYYREANKIKKALLRAYSVLNGIPECYAVVKTLGRQKIVPITKIVVHLEKNASLLGEKHLSSFTPNPIQAWSIGSLLNLLNI